MIYYEQGLTQLRLGHVLEELREIQDESIQMVCTSPPYFQLRDYKTPDKLWGGEPTCEHEWKEGVVVDKHYDLGTSTIGGSSKRQQEQNTFSVPYALCEKCGMFRGQLGMEPDVGLYVRDMVLVFREVRRVLRKDGSLWLNIADSFNNGTIKSCKPKDLLGIPWTVALALRDDGWYLRRDIIWSKGVSFNRGMTGSIMPECLDQKTKVFIRRNGWVSQVTLEQIAELPDLPEILSPDGWVKIRHIWKTTKQSIYMEAGRVEKIICSPEHRFVVSSERRRIKTRLEEAINIRHEGYADYLLYCPIQPFLIPTVTEWMGRSLGYDLGFLLGIYAAEGSLHGEYGYGIKISIHIEEIQLAEKIQKAGKSFSLIFSNREDKGSNCRYLEISCEWFRRTIGYFIGGNNARTKFLNMEIILNTPEEFRKGILDGYIEGDGHKRQGIPGWIVASASEHLRNDVSTLASSLGIITSKRNDKRTDKRTGKTYHAYFLSTPYMTRRKSKSGMDGIYQVPPRSRSLLDIREMIDIEVEGGIFLIGDGLVTHNSAKDRPTTSHEYVFLFSKNQDYFYNYEDSLEQSHFGFRNMRSVWFIPNQHIPGLNHYATFPERIPETAIRSSTSPKGCCPSCGAPYERVVKRKRTFQSGSGRSGNMPKGKYGSGYQGGGETKDIRRGPCVTPIPVGWKPTCECMVPDLPEPCVVLDPFAGSGTVGIVCRKLNRKFIGIDLVPNYLGIAQERLSKIRAVQMELWEG